LRKAREKITKKKAITKEINSRRIVPDSDVEMEGEEEASGSNDKDSDDSDSEDSSSASTSERSGSGGSDESSETDEENFIVNDMSTEAEKKQVKRRIDLHMPHQFRVAKQDDLSHFKVACRYLIHHILLPQVNWRTEIPEFNESCKHLDEFFHAQAVMTLETMSWTADFRRELQKRPYITSQDYRHSSKGCGACHNQSKFSKNFLRLSGKAYSPITLNPVKEKKEADDSGSDSGANNNDDDDDDDDDDDGGSSDSGPPVEQDKQHKFKLELIKVTAKCTTVISGQNCAERALEYHYFKHWKFYVMKRLREQIEPLRETESRARRAYKHTSGIPAPHVLKARKREAWELFRKLDDPASSPFNKSVLEHLYHQTLSRLNNAKKKFGIR